MTKILIGLCFIHFVGDFIFQSNWMATNKWKDFGILLIHGFVYTITLLIGATLLSWNLRDAALFTLINGVAHLMIDFLTSQLTHYFWEKKSIHNFFLIIGLDQFLHTSILILTATFLID